MSAITNLDIVSACKKNHVIKMKKLLKYGKDPNTEDEHGNTLLTIACNKKDLNMVEILLGYKAKLIQKEDLLYWQHATNVKKLMQQR